MTDPMDDTERLAPIDADECIAIAEELLWAARAPKCPGKKRSCVMLAKR